MPVAAPPPKSEREGLSTISSIILGFCGNDAKKAVQCIEKGKYIVSRIEICIPTEVCKHRIIYTFSLGTANSN